MASPLSNPETLATIGAAIGRGATEGAGACLGAGVRTPGLGAALGAAGAGVAAALGGAAAPTEATGAAEPLAGGAAPGARVGSLIVGAEVGLGGKLMRTVSFFGWTLAASAGLGGMEPPPGDVGIFSAISFIFCP